MQGPSAGCACVGELKRTCEIMFKRSNTLVEHAFHVTRFRLLLKGVDGVAPPALWSPPGWLQPPQPLGGRAESCPHPGAQQEAPPWGISHRARPGCVGREEAAAASLLGRRSPERKREKLRHALPGTTAHVTTPDDSRTSSRPPSGALCWSCS